MKIFLFKAEAEYVKTINRLDEERLELRRSVEDLTIKRKIENEDVKHLIRLQQDKLESEFRQDKLNTEKQFREQVMQIREEHQNKREKDLSDQTARLEKMYSEILQRLPNIAVKLKGGA